MDPIEAPFNSNYKPFNPCVIINGSSEWVKLNKPQNFIH